MMLIRICVEGLLKHFEHEDGDDKYDDCINEFQILSGIHQALY